MDKALLDTDILSEILKKRDPNVVSKSTAYIAEHTRLTLSAITVLEITGSADSTLSDLTLR